MFQIRFSVFVVDGIVTHLFCRQTHTMWLRYYEESRELEPKAYRHDEPPVMIPPFPLALEQQSTFAIILHEDIAKIDAIYLIEHAIRYQPLMHTPLA